MQEAFADLGNAHVNIGNFSKLESFVCKIFGFKFIKEVDQNFLKKKT